MNYRTVEVLASGDQTDGSGTKIIDIRVRDIISRFMIYWQVTKVNQGMESYQHKDITKIELVDGSDVLFGLDGGQAQALCIYDRKVPTMNCREKAAGWSLASTYGIDFGRFLLDPLLALDPKQFNNLQLKITFDEAVSDTSATANELGVKAEVFDEKVVNPVGFLSAKEIFAATCPASGYTYIDLPTDRTLRKLLIQGYRKDYEPWNSVANARLDEDNDKRVVFDWNMERYYKMKQAEMTPVVEDIVGLAAVSTGQLFYCTPTDYACIASLTSMDEGIAPPRVDSWQRGGKVTVINPSGGYYFVGESKGYLPNHCFEFPMGNPQDIEDWYDLTQVENLRLRLNAGSGGASGTHSVITQQLRRY